MPNKLYALSLVAVGPTINQNGVNVFGVCHSASWCMATSDEEAHVKGSAKCFEAFPITDYHGHSISLCPIAETSE